MRATLVTNRKSRHVAGGDDTSLVTRSDPLDFIVSGKDELLNPINYHLVRYYRGFRNTKLSEIRQVKLTTGNRHVVEELLNACEVTSHGVAMNAVRDVLRQYRFEGEKILVTNDKIILFHAMHQNAESRIVIVNTAQFNVVYSDGSAYSLTKPASLVIHSNFNLKVTSTLVTDVSSFLSAVHGGIRGVFSSDDWINKFLGPLDSWTNSNVTSYTDPVTEATIFVIAKQTM